MKPFTLNYHGESLTIDTRDLSWVIANLDKAHEEAMRENKSWVNCSHCETPVWTAARVPVCQLCQFIIARDHDALDHIARLMTTTRYCPQSAAVQVARLREEQ